MKRLENKRSWKYKCLTVAATFFIAMNAVHAVNNDTRGPIKPPFEITLPEDTLKPYASYSRGNVYIGSIPELLAVLPYTSEHDVLVIDETGDKNPNFRILDSYKIFYIHEKREILDILFDYDENHNHTWDRTYSSLLNEWITHNFLYTFSIKEDHTTDVDLDNNDEQRFRVFTFK